MRLPKGIAFDEGMLVSDNVGTFDWGEYPYFIKGILLLFLGEIGHFDFFEGIYLWINDSLYFVHTGVGSFSKFAYYDKILQGHAIKEGE